ncbi:PLDc N-terminal domain-containing protein [Agreia sp.]|uniref:PLDc N-terminal domain-containing protein n=1 Tax=Agreia sp. TaxID=1872416 RepID=UPI0035BBBFF5
MEPISATIGSILLFVIFVATVISIVRNPNHGFGGKLVWFIVVLLLSVLGSILWLLFGRGKVTR